MQQSIMLGDNKEYTISTMNVGDLIDIEKKFGTTQLDSGKIEQVMYWIYLGLKKGNKDMTLDNLYTLIDAPFMAGPGMQKLFDALAKVNEWDTVAKNAPGPVAAKK